jgi:hypothetical protein
MEPLCFVYGPENGTDMLPTDDVGLVCPRCGMLTDDNYINPAYKVPKGCPDFSHTYDGFYIVSERFRQTTSAAGYAGLRFIQLPGCPGYYSLQVEQVLEFTRPPGLRFEECCAECERFVSVWGAAHVKVVVPKDGLAEGVYRSDVKMGYRLMMFYCLLATEGAKETLRRSRLTGISFSPASVQLEMKQP